MTHVGAFTLEQTDGAARAGVLQTAHGPVHTPVFMPVGTRATVKCLTPADLVAAKTQIVLSNTYHLALRPGEELIRQFGGLHRFMAWDGPILTDSGGYQVFSLSDLKKISEDGVTFRSHIDGDLVHFTPERVIEIQAALGSDIIMPLDECVAYPCEESVAREAADRTVRWLARSARAKRNDDQILFAIVQGGTHAELRVTCAQQMVEMNLPGYAIGGLSVGEGHRQMIDTLGVTVEHLPSDRPRYLMGVGLPLDVIESVALGVDMFDCVIPTRNARNGMAFTSTGRIKITREEYRTAEEPLDATCACYTCATFSRGYLRHLFAVDEYIARPLLTLHNVTFYNRLLADAREAIRAGAFETYRKKIRDRYEETN